MNYIYTEEPIESAAEATAKSILNHLDKGETVLWLLTGGSGAKIAVIVGQLLRNHDLSKLSVSMTDERIGNIGHVDENWQQILDFGLNLPGANLYRPLTGESREQTTIKFGNWLEQQLAVNDFKIALFGIGSDGHTAGIKPGSSAATSTDFAASFNGNDFERLTITYRGIEQLDEAIIQASGADKTAVIKNLIAGDIDLRTQPAQILRKIPVATIYSNNKEEDL